MAAVVTDDMMLDPQKAEANHAHLTTVKSLAWALGVGR
jgi:hypothetical protein